MAWAAMALPRCGGIAMESSCVPKRMMSKKRSTGDDPKPKPNGHDAVSRQFLMSSVPTGRPYVSPGQRPGKPRTMDCQSPNGAAITVNANSTNLKPRRCCNAKMNDRKMNSSDKGRPVGALWNPGGPNPRPMAWAGIALPRCGGIAMESSCVRNAGTTGG